MTPAQDDATERGQCAFCGRRAVEGAVFEVTVTEERTWAVCPECRYRYEQDVGARYVVVPVILGILFWLQSLVTPGPSEARIVVNGCVIWLMMMLTVLPHEFAHALAARWLGFGIGRVHAGTGPLMLHGRFLGFPFLWRLIPLGGHLEMGTLMRPITLPRLFLVYAAGPASHCIMAGAAWFLMGAPGIDEFDPTRRIEFGWAFIAANTIEIVYNLKPGFWTRNGQNWVSDGLAMLQIIFLRRLPFFPEWVPGRLCRRLYPLMIIASITFGVLAVITMRQHEANKLHVALLFTGCYVFWATGGFLRASRDRRVEDMKQENRGGSLHSQLDVKVRADETAEMDRIGSGVAAALEKLSELKSREQMITVMNRLAAKHPDSFLPVYALAGLYWQAEDWSAAQTALEECLRFELPPAIHAATLIGWASATSYTGSFCSEEVRARLEEYRQTNPPPLALICVLDSLATYVLSVGCGELLPEAGEWTAETMRLARGEITIAGTRGSVLVESGHIAEGEALLREVVQRSSDDNDQAISFLYLAIAAKSRGCIDEAEALARRAKALLMENSLFRRRLELEFPGSGQ
jgi:tetratricopeptide (TPR) repeat protein